MLLPNLESRNNESLMKVLEDMTSNACEIQEEVVEEILTKNANTEYLKSLLHGCPTKELFKQHVPVVEYEDIKDYIDRIANGEPSEIIRFITAEPIAELHKSSGTSGGKQKWIPTTTEEANRKAFFFNLYFNILNKHLEFSNQGKRMFFRFMVPDIITPGGLVVRPVVSSNFRSKTLRNQFSGAKHCPDEVILCEDIEQSIYCQLLCGLVQRDTIVRVGTVFGSIFLRVIKFLEKNWQELCSNIRTGHISDWITDLNCRKAVSLIFSQKMQNLADSIELECKRESWEGIIENLWPNAKCVEVIIAGSMAQYIPTLQFYSGGLPLVSPFYASSEGSFGINLNPLSNPYDVSYSLVPWMAYYEFLALDHATSQEEYRQDAGHSKDAIVDLANVKIGQHYELVVTTFAGLYRYRVGDILMPTDFYNNVPQFKFVERRNVILSVDVDKTTEEDLFKAVKNAVHILEPLGFHLTDYSSYADISTFPGHYVLFWELQTRGNNDGIPVVLDRLKMEECCNVVEGSLDMMYKILRRRHNVIDPLEIRVVKQGTFDALMDLCVSRGTSLSQYKTPKCIKFEEDIRLLNSMLEGSFYASKVLPN